MRVSTLLFAILSTGAISAVAAPIMPDFANVPTGWVTDRYEPDSFSNVGTQFGRDNVLGIGISRSDGYSARPSGFQSTFYNTQGRQHAVSGGVGSVLSADLYIQNAWADTANGTVRSDMWGVMTDGSSITAYPIIGFTNYGNAGGRYRVWDAEAVSGWVDLGVQVNYGDWVAFAIELAADSFKYFIDDVLVYTDSTINGSNAFSATIMQAYNFYGDPSLAGANPVDYTAYWSNTQPAQIPEPASLALLGLGLAGLGWMRRK